MVVDLTEIEARMLKMRINGCKLDVIAASTGVSRERARYTLAGIVRKIAEAESVTAE